MINRDFRNYSYSVYNTTLDAYGQESLVAANGTIKMAINIVNQGTQDSILYSNATYIGLTDDTNITDKYVIQLNSTTPLKVLYINDKGRLKQVYMCNA